MRAARLLALFTVMAVCLPSLGATTGEQPAELEKALRGRVEEFYSLMQVGNWSDAESYVAEDSRATFRQQAKSPFLGFRIESIKLESNGQEATVVVQVQSFTPPMATPLSMPITSRWRQLKNLWEVVFPKPEPRASVFGRTAGGSPPRPEELKFKGHRYHLGTVYPEQVKVARFPFTNPTDHTVTIKEVLVGGEWLQVKLDKKEYKPGESGEIAVEFHPRNYKYNFIQSIVVKTDPGNVTSLLHITAYVDPTPRELRAPPGEKKQEAKSQP